uniref:Protein phosphatase 1 regulatory subunit 17 n=1 Tax=Moschus moschiferus TaxID=68415 RepID=A0A8C6FMK1_MOSMO
MMSTEQMQPLELSEDRLDKLDSLCGHLDVLSEHLITRYEVQDIQPKGKISPVLHNSDLEPKKPRRKDTPALHVSPFAAGVTLLRDERPKVIMEDEEKDGDKIAI